MLSEVLVFNPELVSICFVNKADSRGSYKDDAADILEGATNLHYLDNPIGNRIAFANAAAEGLGVMETHPLDEKAVNELSNLFKNIKVYMLGS